MTKENYPACVAFVRKQEGGNTDTPGDRGGRTGRGGITHATYDEYRVRHGLPPQDVFRISDAEIADIYKANYWTPIHGDILEAGVDLCVFDYAINSGPGKANAVRLQIEAETRAPPEATIHAICSKRLSFMHSLGSWSRFGSGWGRRVAECEATALRMAEAPLGPVLKDARAKQVEAKQKAKGTVVAGLPAGGASQLVHGGLWVLAIIIGGIALVVAISALNAWRHGQRADALSAAIKRMRDGQAAAFAAKMAADTQAGVEAKVIEAKKAALDAARAAIGDVQISKPGGSK